MPFLRRATLGPVQDGEGSRSYGIWGFVAAFAALGLVGVVLLLLAGSGGPTTQLDTPQTLPETTTSVELPDGVSDVLVDGGTAAYVVEVPDAVEDVTDLEGAEAVVAPLSVRVDDAGRLATLEIGCAGSAQEVLAQVIVTSGEDAVTFAAVSLVPPGGPDCDDAVAPRTLELPLSEPLGRRAVVVVPQGTEVPDLGTG